MNPRPIATGLILSAPFWLVVTLAALGQWKAAVLLAFIVGVVTVCMVAIVAADTRDRADSMRPTPEFADPVDGELHGLIEGGLG